MIAIRCWAKGMVGLDPAGLWKSPLKVRSGWPPLTSGPVGPITQRVSGTETALGTTGVPLPCWPPSGGGQQRGQLCWAPSELVGSLGPQQGERWCLGGLRRQDWDSVCLSPGKTRPSGQVRTVGLKAPSHLLSGYKIWIAGKSKGNRKFLHPVLLNFRSHVPSRGALRPRTQRRGRAACSLGTHRLSRTGLSHKLTSAHVTWGPAGLEVG